MLGFWALGELPLGTVAAGVVPPPPIPGPRGAWISDRKVEKARRQEWKRRREAEEDLREALDELITGKPSKATLALQRARHEIEMALIELPALDPALVQLRADVKALQENMRAKELRQVLERFAFIEARAEEEEEAGIVSLLMAVP